MLVETQEKLTEEFVGEQSGLGSQPRNTTGFLRASDHPVDGKWNEFLKQIQLQAAPKTGKLAEALAKAQAEFKSVNKSKTAKGEKFSYKYADLADVLGMALPILAKYGIFFSQPLIRKEDKVLLVTRVQLGEEVYEDGGQTVPQQIKPQEFGTYLTYFRRYGVSTFLGIVTDEDTDAVETRSDYSDRTITVTDNKAVVGTSMVVAITKKTPAKPAVRKADKQTDFPHGANSAPASEPVKEQATKFEASEDDIPDNIGSPKPTQADYNAYGITFRGFGVDMNKIGSYMRKKYNVEKPKDELNKTQWDETVTELKAAFEAKTLTELLQEKK